jgi:hypothetical protein
MRALISIAAVGLALVVMAGCGGGSTTSGAGSSTTATGGEGPGAANTTAKAAPKPGPPTDKESIEQAKDRIAEVASSNDCQQVNELNPLSRPGLNGKARCEALQRLAALKATGAAQYGDAGVIEYALPSRPLAVLLVRDSDGLFKITYEDSRLRQPSIGTPFAKQFDAVADRAVKALAHKDCDAFYAVAFQEFGPSAGDKSAVCDGLDVNPLVPQLEKDPGAEPQRMGGNGSFAFYGLDLPGSFWTLVMAKETPSDVFPKGSPKLPKGAPTYGYVDAFRTNPPPSEPGDSK